MTASANISERGADGIVFEAARPASQPGDTFPAGSVMLYAGAAAPTGWFICDGSAISRAGFPTLFTNIGTSWGAGNGVTTFNIPDFRDRVPVGKSGTKALASTGGAETHSITVPEMPSHDHGGATGTQSANHSHGGPGFIFAEPEPSGTAVISSKVWGTTGATVWEDNFTTTTESATHSHPVSAQGGGSAMSLLQPYAAINYIIRAY